jgi:hypothetical protein
MSAAGPPQGAQHRSAQREGTPVITAGPPQGARRRSAQREGIPVITAGPPQGARHRSAQREGTPANAALRRKLVLLVLALLLVAGLAVAWSWSPLRAWLDVDALVGAVRAAGRSFGPLAALAALTVALVLAVPLMFLTVVAVAAYGPVLGSACVFVGALLAAGASHGAGRYLGREVLERLAGPRVNLLSHRLARRGLLAVLAVRLVPVAPFRGRQHGGGGQQPGRCPQRGRLVRALPGEFGLVAAEVAVGGGLR